MIVTDLSKRLHEALMDPDPRESETRIKASVADAMAAFDPSAKVSLTSYFNHSLAPDMVLSWGKVERQVFLRFTDNVRELVHDIDQLGRLDPLVFGLSTPSADAVEDNSIHERSKQADVLFTAPDALDALTHRDAPAATDRMLRNSLAQGGRGALVDGTRATSLADTVHDGFDAASTGAVSSTRMAVTAIGEYFREGQAKRLNRVMQAVWEAAGARLDQFPGAADLSERLSDLSLLYLLQFMDTPDAAFWRGIGRGLDFGQVLSLQPIADLANFQHLLNANLDVLRARACYILDMSLFDEDAQAYLWGIDVKAGEGSVVLTLRGPGFQAFITRSKDELESRVPTEDRACPDVGAFTERASVTRLVAVDVSGGGKHVSFRDDNDTFDTRFVGAATSQLTSPFVDKATVATPSGRVTVDFKRSTGTGITKSETSLRDLVKPSVNLLVALRPTWREALDLFLSVAEQSYGVDEPDMLPFHDEELNSLEGDGAEDLPIEP